MHTQINNSILASLSADSYLLGSHWVYDEEQLQNLPIDWESLNPPQAMWHKGKTAGDFTHYGDQSVFLLEYLQNHKTFDKKDFYSFWTSKMSSYKGYIDGATRNALENIGSANNDLSICGRIAPLLLVASSKDTFLHDISELVTITHNSELAKTATKFFAELLWDTKENQDLQGNIQKLKQNYPTLLKWIDDGVASKTQDTFSVIRDFGPACGIDGGFAGAIHLLSLGDDFKTTMQKNAKAGGDSSARGMAVAMILGIDKNFKLHDNWTKNINNINKIREYLHATI